MKSFDHRASAALVTLVARAQPSFLLPAASFSRQLAAAAVSWVMYHELPRYLGRYVQDQLSNGQQHRPKEDISSSK